MEIKLENPEDWKYIAKFIMSIAVASCLSLSMVSIGFYYSSKSQKDMSHFQMDYIDNINDENQRLRITVSYLRSVIQKFVVTMRHYGFKSKLSDFGQETIDEIDKTFYLVKYKEILEKEIKDLERQLVEAKNVK